MSQIQRGALKPKFANGQRPEGQDFENLIDSFVNMQDDKVSFDKGDLVLQNGVRLGDSTGNVPGGLRFNNNQLQVFTGGVWTNVSSGGGAFQSVGGSATAVAHDGNVGIGTFAAAPTFKLEVNLGASGTPADLVRFGSAAIGNGVGAFGGFAVFSHQNRTAGTDFALRQGPNGNVHINAPAGQQVRLGQGGNPIMAISTTGKVVVGTDVDVPGAGTAILQVSGDAFKTTGGGVWSGSDARLKEDVRDLETGLSELKKVRPVRFRYNGRAGTPAGRDGVGVIGQEIESVFPETVRRVSVADDPGLDEMRIFDPSSLTYALINAVKELSARVEHLEEALAAATSAPSPEPAIP